MSAHDAAREDRENWERPESELDRFIAAVDSPLGAACRTPAMDASIDVLIEQNHRIRDLEELVKSIIHHGKS